MPVQHLAQLGFPGVPLGPGLPLDVGAALPLAEPAPVRGIPVQPLLQDVSNLLREGGPLRLEHWHTDQRSKAGEQLLFKLGAAVPFVQVVEEQHHVPGATPREGVGAGTSGPGSWQPLFQMWGMLELTSYFKERSQRNTSDGIEGGVPTPKDLVVTFLLPWQTSSWASFFEKKLGK
jgi:hypothetical protein